jgi:hypothetical protein
MLLSPGSLTGEGSSPDEARFAGLIGTVVFGLALLISLATARGPQRVALLPAGLRWELGARPSFAAWDDIEDISTYEIRGSRFLTIDARDAGRPRSLGQRLMDAANRAVTRSDASIGLDVLPVDGDRLARAIARCCDSPERRRAIGTEESLRWLVPTGAGGSRRAPRGRPSGPRLPRPAAR